MTVGSGTPLAARTACETEKIVAASTSKSAAANRVQRIFEPVFMMCSFMCSQKGILYQLDSMDRSGRCLSTRFTYGLELG